MPIYEERFIAELAGYFIAERGSSAIVVNQNDVAYLKRFTIAHELGHFISYKLQDKIGVIRDDRVNLASLNVNLEEQFANNFATELLMPETRFNE